MNTSIMMIALASVVSVPAWHSDYSKAQLLSSQQNKPLVVLFGPGTNGWTRVIRDQAPSDEVTRLLTDRYVCVHIDTSSPEGMRFAARFEINGSTGMVVSDRRGLAQAFWHQGDLTNATVAHFLQKYADPNIVVSGTETATSVRNSFYPGNSYPSPAPVGRTMSSGNC